RDPRAGPRRQCAPHRAHARRAHRERSAHGEDRGRVMNPRESVGIALGALRANKLRSFLTLLGTIIGVAAVIAVLSFVEGLNRYVSDKLLAAGSNVFWVDKFGIVTSQDAWVDVMKRRDITPDDADALRAVPHASMVVAMASGNATCKYREHTVNRIEVRGRGAGFEQVDDVSIVQGRGFTEADDLR